jgi:hypothetical protein
MNPLLLFHHKGYLAMSYHRLLLTSFLLLATMTASCSSSNLQQPQTSTQPENTQSPSAQATQFKVRIENISAPDAFTASNGVKWSAGFSPGFWIVHTSTNPIFIDGQADQSKGLESQAEDGKPDLLVQSLAEQSGIVASGVFNTPNGANKPAPLEPGGVYEFTVSATPGEHLAFTTMFGQSNDWFYAPGGTGISLFDAQGNPIAGDITPQILLWNAGTEVDQEPGIGSDQAPRQKAENMGTPENGVIHQVSDRTDLEATQVMRVTISPE